MNITTEIIVLILLLLLSAFFSSSELAFVVSNKIKLEIWARKSKYAAKQAQYFVNHSEYFYSTILISNNIVLIAFASICTVVLLQLYAFSDLSILLISTSLILLFGELLPKYLAVEYADSFVLVSAPAVRIVFYILYPIVKIISKILRLISSVETQKEKSFLKLVEKDDLQNLIIESSKAGAVGEEETDIIKKILDLGEQKVYEVMTPRTDIVGVEFNDSIDKVIETFIKTGYSKLPVYKENMDKIIGLVMVYDMFKRPEKLNDVMRDVSFVPETKKSLEMFNEFLDRQQSISIVVDEFGGTAGVVSLEDIIEEMFGEIRDEYDDEDLVCREVSPGAFVINGKFEIDRLREEFNIDLPEGDYETIAGLIVTQQGNIPKKGETIFINDFKISIIHSDQTKINLVKLFKINS